MKSVLSLLAVCLISGGMQTVMALSINEIRIDQPGTDNDEYFELAGDPGESLNGLSYIVIGDGSGESGVIESVVALDGLSLNPAGLFTVAESTFGLGGANLTALLNFENSDNVTHLLVDGFTAVDGEDLDTDDDGILDSQPWSRVVDSVALVESVTSGEQIYSANTVGPDGTFVPGHVFRQPDASGGWQIGQFDTSGGEDTPGFPNSSDNPPPPASEMLGIPEIQGAGHVSPYDGVMVKTRGIVTAVAGNGFYLQDATGDGNAATSDAIFAFTGDQPSVAVGDEIEVEALVTEFIPGGATTQNLSITELNSPVITLLASRQALPPAVIIGESGRLPPDRNVDDDGLNDYNPDSDGIDFYESMEAMRVIVKDAQVVSPINRFNEIVVLAEQGRYASGVNARGGITIRSDDYNPERLQVQLDETFLPDFTVRVNSGDLLGDVLGVMSYSFGNFELIAMQAFTVTPAGLEREMTSLEKNKKALSIASYNVLNLDPNELDGSEDIANGQFQGLADTIVTALKTPDIIGLQEIQDNSGSDDDGTTDASLTYQTLIDAIVAARGPRYRYADIAPENNRDGGQPGGNIRVGYLYNPKRVKLVKQSLRRLSDAAFADSRKPLAAQFKFRGDTVTVINNHFSSKGGSTPIFGQVQPFINAGEEIRAAQATVVRDYVAELLAGDPASKIVVLGDMNEFQFNSPLLALKGRASALLTDLVETLPLFERYSYLFEGNAQALDHLLVSPALAGRTAFDVVHVNAEFADQSSDHDPLLAHVDLSGDKGSSRFATFNASLNRAGPGELIADLSAPDDPQAKAVAEIIQRSAPDVLLLNEFDYDPDGLAARLFLDNYLAVSQNGGKPQTYRYVYSAESNTGVPSGFDLDRDGGADGPGDAFGFGFFPGQFGMLLLSKYPIDYANIRTFQHFLWRDMPGALLPDDPQTPEPMDWYGNAALDQLRLSSKSHWDVPVRIHGRRVHVLASHPTPPVFDGPEDRNGRRNHDEIRFWADYITADKADYIYDDSGRFGGLRPGSSFVIMGDMNADPVDGDSTAGAIDQLLLHAAVNTSITPVSRGATEASNVQGGANDAHVNAPDFDTADFADSTPGNLRADYVLPSQQLTIQQAGVFWPLSADPEFAPVGEFPFPASDHRLVWLDIRHRSGWRD